MSILHIVGDALRDTLGLIPLWGVRGLFLILLFALMAWIVSLPNSETTDPEGPRDRPGRNLKWWAWTAILIQVVVYSVF